MRSSVRAAAFVAVVLVWWSPRAHADDALDARVGAAVERLVGADAAALDRALSSVDPVARQAAATVVWRRHAATPAQVAELTAAAGDDVGDVRLAATRALGVLGDAALPAAARLERLAGWASDVRQRHLAALALARIPSARENLYRLFVDPTLREDTATGLATLGAEGRAALVLLTDAPAWRTRVASLTALAGAVDVATDADVIAAFERHLRDDSEAVRCAALRGAAPLYGGWMLKRVDVERVFAPDASALERLLVLVALADVRLPGDAEASEVQVAGALAALASADPYVRLTGARLAYAARVHDDRVLLALARVACADDAAAAREAAAALRLLGREAGGLSDPVAEAIRPATASDTARIATEAAAALASAGHDDPELAAPLARLLYAEYWGGWKGGTMAHPPSGWSRRNLRAGGPRHALPTLPPVPLLALDDVVLLLRRHPDTTAAALVPFLRGEYSATRANAAWFAAETLSAATAEELLRPLLDDPVRSVRIVAALRLARLGAATDDAARLFVAVLLADPSGLDSDRDGPADAPDGPLRWDAELLGELHRAPPAVISALVDAFASRADVDGDSGQITATWQWTEPSGAAHVPEMLTAVGQEGQLLLIDALLEGDATHRQTAAYLLQAVGTLAPAARERLRGLRDHAEVGSLVRSLLGD